MKRSLFTVVAILVGMSAPVLADDNNKSQIDQVGTNSTATVEQGGSGTTNDSFVKQDGGDSNTVAVKEKGTSNHNHSDVFQFGGGETTIVNQKGDSNSNDSKLAQAGFNNSADIEQGGDGNINGSLIHIEAGTDNIIDVDQHGSSNANDSSISTFLPWQFRDGRAVRLGQHQPVLVTTGPLGGNTASVIQH